MLQRSFIINKHLKIEILSKHSHNMIFLNHQEYQANFFLSQSCVKYNLFRILLKFDLRCNFICKTILDKQCHLMLIKIADISFEIQFNFFLAKIWSKKTIISHVIFKFCRNIYLIK